jgi:sulfur-oxidizing protein SoxZ
MADAKPRVKVPSSAKAGEVVTIKTLISHPMETGLRKDKKGDLIPRQIINRFVATFNGQEVINVAMETAVAANPYFQFDMKVPESGTLKFEWTDDDGSVYSAEENIAVT